MLRLFLFYIMNIRKLEHDSFCINGRLRPDAVSLCADVQRQFICYFRSETGGEYEKDIQKKIDNLIALYKDQSDKELDAIRFENTDL